MNLFEECKAVLKQDIKIISQEHETKIILENLSVYLDNYARINKELFLLKEYGLAQDIIENEDVESLLSKVYVVADTHDVPIFESTLKSILQYSDDVFALSTKVFVFNSHFILTQDFPNNSFKLGLRTK